MAHSACAQAPEEILHLVGTLIARGADVNIAAGPSTPFAGLTPIEVAQKLGDEALVAVLRGTQVRDAIASTGSGGKQSEGKMRKDKRDKGAKGEKQGMAHRHHNHHQQQQEQQSPDDAAQVDDIDLLLS